ncbi:MAG: UV damage endonuclease UvsE [Chloroflexi bacterium]|nr:UV damage endonuclease UvsE [Chloroflexota bacterium]
MRLGFPVHVFGCPDLPAHDARRWPDRPHLSVSLARLRDILCYLQANDLHMYRMHARLLPRPLACREGRLDLAECEAQLALLGELAGRADVRLSFHAPGSLVLNARNEEQADAATAWLASWAALLDAMGQGPEAVIVLHVGGVYDSVQASIDRFCRRFDALPLWVQSRLALEQDDRRFGYCEVLAIHRRCGLPLVFDNLHHQVLNPGRVPFLEALRGALSTWPAGVVPKVHFSSPRTEMRVRSGASRVQPPSWTEHSDLVNPFEFISFLEGCQGLPDLDILIEARARDLAVLRLRQDLRRFAPELVPLVC